MNLEIKQRQVPSLNLWLPDLSKIPPSYFMSTHVPIEREDAINLIWKSLGSTRSPLVLQNLPFTELRQFKVQAKESGKQCKT